MTPTRHGKAGQGGVEHGRGNPHVSQAVGRAIPRSRLTLRSHTLVNLPGCAPWLRSLVALPGCVMQLPARELPGSFRRGLVFFVGWLVGVGGGWGWWLLGWVVMQGGLSVTCGGREGYEVVISGGGWGDMWRYARRIKALRFVGGGRLGLVVVVGGRWHLGVMMLTLWGRNECGGRNFVFVLRCFTRSARHF